MAEATGTTFLDILKTGVSGYIDSQIAKNYAVSDPAYNTAGGRGGQAQATPGTLAAAGSNVLWIAGAVVAAVLVVFLVARR